MLQGGLGNQLFQYFAGSYLAAKLGCQLRIDVRLCQFGYSGHGATIADFFLEGEIKVSQSSFSPSFLIAKYSNYARGALQRIVRDQELNQKLFAFYRSKVLGFDVELGRIKKPLVLQGYFQTWKYHFEVASKTGVLRSRRVSQSPWFEQHLAVYDSQKVVAIHIRRGDYLLEGDKLGLLDEKYFLSALEALKEDGLSWDKIWIFTDDVHQVTSSFQTLIVSHSAEVLVPPKGSNPIDSLLLMSEASALVMSNSSFSWWAGKLGKTSKKVVAPEPWFRNLENPDELYPPEWLRAYSIWTSGKRL